MHNTVGVGEVAPLVARVKVGGRVIANRMTAAIGSSDFIVAGSLQS